MDQTIPGPGSNDGCVNFKREPPDPDLSCLSIQSDRSKDCHNDFKRDSQLSDLSSQSMQSDRSKDCHNDFNRRKLKTPGNKTRRESRSRPGSVPSCESLRSKGLSIDFKRDSKLPDLSCQSMQSDRSKEWGIGFKRKNVETLERKNKKKSRFRPNCESLRSKGLSINIKRDSETSGQGLSCQSMQSDKSKEWGIDFKDSTFDDTEEELCPEQLKEDPHLRHIFMQLKKDILTFVKEKLRMFYKTLASDYPECLEPEEEGQSTEAVLNLTVDFLKRMRQEPLAERLHSKSSVGVCTDKLKKHLQQKFSCVSEGIAKAGNPSLLNQIYTEPHIIEGGAAEVNQEHEVRHIEAANRKPAVPETTVTCEDIFNPHKQRPIREEATERPGTIRTVLTKGVAGVGKTMLTQKFTLDWAESRANQDVQLLFPFTFRELNVLRDRQFSLVELLHHFFSQTKALCGFQHLQVLFIFDGLDECRLPLDFSQTRVLTEPTERALVEELLVNLIRGDLLPSARLLITTRPAAANQIPAKCVSMVTVVRGFNDTQKEQYFKKRFRNEQEAAAMISHIKKSQSLFIMCHLPVFCWMLATVLRLLMKSGVKEQLPQTMTEMYIHFLVVQAKAKSVKYDGRSESDPHWSPETKRMLKTLAKLAFEQLMKGNLIFYEFDLRECGLDAADASVYSGVFTQVFREEPGLYQDKVYCFIHLTLQEFLAALHVHLTFFNSGVNLLPVSIYRYADNPGPECMFYRSAVEKALQSPNGHLDLFLRFLLGLSLPANQSLLSGLLPQTGRSSQTNMDTAWYIKEILDQNYDFVSAEMIMNLLHCLNELNNHSLLESVQQSLREGRLSDKDLPCSEWSAVAFLVLSSNSDLEEFDLRKCEPSEAAFFGLLPLVKASTRAILSGCNLTDDIFIPLASVLDSSTLNHLDLSNNDLSDSGVKQLCDKLKSAPRRLEVLSLSGCFLTHSSCASLTSVLGSSALTHLDLSNNDLGDSGVEQLCAGLKSAPCRLEVLRLSGCLVSERGGASLALALSSAHCGLRELDLGYNHPGPSAELLTAVRDDPRCPLDSLRLEPAGESWMVPGLRKYLCEVILDPNTANNTLEVSEDKHTVTNVEELQLYPHHEDRFTSCSQVLSSTALRGRCYCEVEITGDVDIAVSYRGIKRNGDSEECRFGDNDQSWSLRTRGNRCSFFHCKKKTEEYPFSDRVGVFLDTEAGVLSFYIISEDKWQLLHTFSCSFSEPLFVGFGLERPGSSVSLL